MKKIAGFLGYLILGAVCALALEFKVFWMIPVAIIATAVFEFLLSRSDNVDYKTHDEINARLVAFRERLYDARKHNNHGLAASVHREMEFFEQTITEDENGHYHYKA